MTVVKVKVNGKEYSLNVSKTTDKTIVCEENKELNDDLGLSESRYLFNKFTGEGKGKLNKAKIVHQDSIKSDSRKVLVGELSVGDKVILDAKDLKEYRMIGTANVIMDEIPNGKVTLQLSKKSCRTAEQFVDSTYAETDMGSKVFSKFKVVNSNGAVLVDTYYNYTEAILAGSDLFLGDNVLVTIVQ